MKVAAADRRKTVRRNIKTPIRVRRWKSGLPEEESVSENLSENGILFATDEAIRVGTVLEILLQMPELITCEPATEWLCAGHVVRVEPIRSANGRFGVSVQFDCYQVARESAVPAMKSSSQRLALNASGAEPLDEESRALCLRVIQGLTARTSE
jgi:hypothetical protein